MRKVGKLLLLAVAALTAMAFAASSASALTATNEDTGVACPAVSGITGGCAVHANSEGAIELRKHVFGIESHITSCGNEFKGRLNGSAAGVIYDQVLSTIGGNPCTRQACATGTPPVKTPWNANGTEGAALEGNEYLTTNFCVEPVGGGTDETCEIDVPFQSSGDHTYEFGHATEMPSHGISGFRCELVGHWNTEDTAGDPPGSTYDDVEVAH